MFNPNDHLISLPGKGGNKQYLQVMHRLVWFRDEYPEGQIDTSVIELTADRAVFHAIATAIKDGTVVGRASGTGSETPRDFGDFIEKAETKAVGRALAMLGFGTQFAPEFDEGDRIVDSPVTRQNAPQRTEPAQGSNGTSQGRTTRSGPSIALLDEVDNLPAKPHADKPITDVQKKMLYALADEIAQKLGWPKDWVKRDLYAHFNVTSTTQMTTAQGAHAIRALYAVKDKNAVFIDALQTMKG